MSTYYCESDPNNRDILAAGIANGTLHFWRTDSDGNRWFRTAPTIIGTPRTGARDYDLTEVEDDPGECELISDGEVIASGEPPPVRGVDPNSSVRFELPE
jgi:hypothetical protein